MTYNSDILFTTEYIKNVLCFATVRQGKVLKNTVDTQYFCIDDELVYENYYSDFGPLNLGCVYKYCILLNEKLKQYLNKQLLVHYTSIDPKKKANAAFLLGCYGVLYLSLPPRDALKPLLVRGQSYRPFQDATQGDSSYTITLLDCMQAIKKARDLGFFNFQDFNYEEYNRLDKIQGGDLNWIVPGKFLAFIGPVDYSVSLYHPPEMYIDYFLENNVKIVIRLNKRLYNEKVFSDVAITHYDLFFPDGSCPPRHILFKFLQISEDSNDAIAVHCKAGLGRTGSLIGCYLIKHYRMTYTEAISWMRICRPGSVIGHQQGWLKDLEPWLLKQGNLYRKRMYQDTERLPIHEFGIYSMTEKAIQKTNHQKLLKSPSPSPPIPMQRQAMSNIRSVIRPQTSKFRDLNKAPEKEKCDRFVTIPKLNNVIKNQQKGDQNDMRNKLSRQGSTAGAGEPRVGRTPSHNITIRTQMQKGNVRTSESTRNSGLSESYYHPNYSPIPTFCTTQGPVIKTINDARNFLMRSSKYNEERERHLNSLITVTPKLMVNLLNNKNSGEHPRPSNVTYATPSSYTTANRTPVQPQQRRRLGRSPSPPQIRNEETRATNTPTPAERIIARDASKAALRESLSRLKLTSAGRDNGSIGVASLGAASLGARRDAPAPKRAPSVRSDDRSLATQGDMLNSIKPAYYGWQWFDVMMNANGDRSETHHHPNFQRRFRETLQFEKQAHNNHGSPNKEKPSIKNVNSKSSTGTKPGANNTDFSSPKAKSTPSRGFFSQPRPSSPKARRSILQPNH